MPSTIPEGYTTVTPWIISADTPQLLEFIVAAFEGVELSRMANADGSIGHAEIRIGDAIVMAFDAPEGLAAMPAFIRLYVPDERKGFARALDSTGGFILVLAAAKFWLEHGIDPHIIEDAHAARRRPEWKGRS